MRFLACFFFVSSPLLIASNSQGRRWKMSCRGLGSRVDPQQRPSCSWSSKYRWRFRFLELCTTTKGRLPQVFQGVQKTLIKCTRSLSCFACGRGSVHTWNRDRDDYHMAKAHETCQATAFDCEIRVAIPRTSQTAIQRAGRRFCF